MSELEEFLSDRGYSFLLTGIVPLLVEQNLDLLGLTLSYKEGGWYAILRARRNGTRWVLFGSHAEILPAIGSLYRNLVSKRPDWRRDRYQD